MKKIISIKYQGQKYVGEVNRKNQPHGWGTFHWENGKIFYHGQWKNGSLHGQGLLYYKNGKIAYSGQWKKGKQHGLGYYEDGKIYNYGKWKNDIKVKSY